MTQIDVLFVDDLVVLKASDGDARPATISMQPRLAVQIAVTLMTSSGVEALKEHFSANPTDAKEIADMLYKIAAEAEAHARRSSH
jgi:hypothetical protein